MRRLVAIFPAHEELGTKAQYERYTASLHRYTHRPKYIIIISDSWCVLRPGIAGLTVDQVFALNMFLWRTLQPAC